MGKHHPDGWTVHIEVETESMQPIDQAAMGRFLEEMEPLGGSVVSGPGRYSATFSIHSDWLPSKVVDAGLTEFQTRAHNAGLPGGVIVRVDVLTFAEHDRELAHPNYVQLVGVSEIADVLGVTRQRMTVLQTRPGFPKPLAVLKAGPVWDRGQLGHFLETWERKPGRPARVRDAVGITDEVKATVTRGE